MKLNRKIYKWSSLSAALVLVACDAGNNPEEFLTLEAQDRLSTKNAPAPPAKEKKPAASESKTVDAEDATAKVDPAVLAKALKDGKAKYATSCQTCHQPTGAGLPGVFPPLAKSDWVNKLDNEELIRIALRGLTGPIKVNGVEYNGAMTSQTMFLKNDQEFADVLTYVVNSWDNKGGIITADEVKKVREAEKDNLTKMLTAEDIKGLDKLDK